ncbi:NAD(P)/FAD-dependent oxidoreductase [Clostridium intestinale]|uniref:NAD(P)/FAD-dependent oxidoreductase n=1 Tax=Clostridium intestinale TaxID=36845 RepID=A0A7D6ZUE5_9CLOT|nr:NAD(P)/FAD-dependent oxidoreductase [Clostridium intestinale]QLY79993.1 NAD(P)/FAD-dependent oxidoreductase [Clostridium intestinale]
MIHHNILIVGGGASGLMSAILLKDFGLDVAIVEGTDRVGKKILTTGNGRCNISNNNINYPFLGYYSDTENFFVEVLNKFSVEDTLNFFSFLGLPIVELEKGKLYPQSLQASSVVDIFRLALEDRKIPVYNSCKIKSIHKRKKFILSTDNTDFSEFSCEKLILSCGGKSAEKTGSDGSGYKLAKELGHSIIKPLPAIVQLKLNYPSLKALSGTKFDALASILVDDIVIRSDLGEVLFTDYGISGPPILQLSHIASKSIENDKKVSVVVDLFPNKSEEDIENFIYGHFSMFSHRKVIDSLIGVLNKKLIPTFLKEAKINDLHKPVYDLTWSEKSNIISLMKKWQFSCVGTNGFNNAQVTSGGINTSEVNSSTLESRIIDNLYFTGEILDVHGDCGGFNLQWAWSSAYAVATALKN